MYVNAVNIFNKVAIDTLQVGKTLPIDIIKQEGENALIKIDGLEVYAHLNTDSREGDRFFVRVKSLENGLLILEKLNVNTRLDTRTTMDLKDHKQVLVPFERVIDSPLPGEGPTSSEAELLLNEAAISAEKLTPHAIIRYLQNLGLDYEKRIFEGLQQGNPKILAELKSTIKAKALRDPKLSELVHWITEQQFWQNAGEHHRFMLLTLFVRYQERLQKFRMASLFPRQKNSSGLDHFRIGLKATTDRFGEIGLEARIYGHALSLQIFTGQPELLKPAVEHLRSETVASFQKAGYQLLGLEVSPMNRAEDFDLFMKGCLATEVDVWI